ncbi:MAG: O-methyltransferase [Ilumatobacteraceae bacterium]
METRRISRIDEPRLAGLLESLHAQAEANDGKVLPGVLTAAVERGAKTDQDMSDLLADAYIPISPTVGRFVHLLALARPDGRIVEFGTSHGLSTLYLAATIEQGGLPVITTEAEPKKAAAARANFEAAGLATQVDLREGDAFASLADLDEPISLLFLDGWKGLYLPLLQMLEDHLVPGALVVADDTTLLPDLCADYLAYVRGNPERFVSASLPVDDGLEVSVAVR